MWFRIPGRTLERLAPGVFLLLPLLMCGCRSVGYYTQAVKGHCQIVARQTSCAALLSDTNTPPELRAKLQLARELCAFAEHELGLPAHGAYQRYADLSRPFVVWNVYAAPAFSLEAKTWWYPFVGSLDYRGYFTENGARKCADLLEARGFDAYVEGVEAYSTLGWFKDPLLNTFLHHEEPILAEVLFHELAHQRVFASGDTDFNEAFATTVAQAGVRRWLRYRGEGTLLQHYESALDRNDAFVDIVQTARRQLEHLYNAEDGNRPDCVREAAKQEVLERLRQDFAQLRHRSEHYAPYAPWFATRLNNAKLNSVATYYDLVPAFDRLLAKHRGKLEPFYESVQELTRLSEEQRHAHLATLHSDLATER